MGLCHLQVQLLHGTKIYSLGLQSDIVILTNDNPLGEPPNEIIADIVAGYEDHILNHNAIVPYQPGFLQDPCRLPFTSLEFAMELNYECATLCPSMQCSCPSVLPCSKACLGVNRAQVRHVMIVC